MSIQLDLDSFDLIRIVSIGINLVFIYLWARDKFLLRRFLVGKWEGHLIHSDENDIFDCQLLIAEQKDRDNAGFFYYECKQLEDGKLLLRGLDKLQDYEDDILFVKNRIWKAKFAREFNKSLSRAINTENPPPYYDWKCSVKSLYFRPKMEVVIDTGGRTFTGLLTKS